MPTGFHEQRLQQAHSGWPSTVGHRAEHALGGAVMVTGRRRRGGGHPLPLPLPRLLLLCPAWRHASPAAPCSTERTR